MEGQARFDIPSPATRRQSSANGFFSLPVLVCVGNMGRNTFVGPSFVFLETSLFKNNEDHREGQSAVSVRKPFNVLNHTNFQLPGAGGATNYRTNSGSFGQAGAPSTRVTFSLG
jgi:hypothetical protein